MLNSRALYSFTRDAPTQKQAELNLLQYVYVNNRNSFAIRNLVTPVNMNTNVMRAVTTFRIPRGRLKSFGSFIALRSGKTKAIPSYENNEVPKLKAIWGILVIKSRSSADGIPSMKATARVAIRPKTRQILPIFDTGEI
uniref:Uncharacterized protein n=1 Tax=Glossina austeni TaxID=7395 RepID=A0A1A9VBZ2_GLOAU